MVEAVVWDIGNVLGIWDPVGYYDARIGPEARERFFAETGIEAVNEQLDMGARATETLAAHAEKHPQWAAEIRAWFDDWALMFAKPVEGSAEVFEEVKAAGFPVFALSNFWAETLVIAKEIHPVLKGFDREFVSAHLQCIKPDPAIYAALEEATGLSGASLIFVDDKPENIAAAEARGWKGHVFEDAAGWRARLVAEGVLTR
ncbi:MAG: HAD-IA family hydrolase [Silicimonas sp.]|jgi:2-haloacid dehalogenase|nr:HAD-IA family hydrolase [Silicimonas sp.]